MISVIVPLYKGNIYVKAIVDNITRNYKEKTGNKEQIELIFVNDYPNEQIVIPENNNLIEIFLIEHEKNLGIQQARVSGLLMARGEYILFLDQDDEIADDFIDSQLKRIEDADVVVANGYRVFNDRKKLLYKKETIGRWLNKYDMFVYGTCLIFSPGQCLIKRTSIPKEWCELLLTQNGSDDYLLWLIMLQKNNRFVFNNKPLYSHKEHENNFSTSSQNMIAAFDAVITVLEKNRMVDKKHLRALCKRLEIKKTKRSIQSYAYMIGNPQILLYTMLYKFNGFH